MMTFNIIAIIVFVVLLAYTFRSNRGYISDTSKEKAYEPPSRPSVRLDNQEIQNLGNAAADWCGSWLLSSVADHKWLVIEVTCRMMDCKSLSIYPPYDTYPHCTIKFSKEIDREYARSTAEQILAIISARYPEMITTYGLHLDGWDLILWTNSE